MSKRPRGPQPNWEPTTDRQKAILADLVARYAQHAREDTLPRSGRGMFYDLRPHGKGNGVTYRKASEARPTFGPMEASPDHVQEVLVSARRAGKIREDWVADARAPDPISEPTFDDADDFAGQVAKLAEGFRLDLQRDQDVYVELWTEAEDLAPRFARVADGPYGVPVYSGGGYGGLKGRRQLAARAVRRDVPTVVLVVTDRDKHGDRIYSSAAEDATAWAEKHYGAPAAWLRFERIAVTAAQARAHDVLDDDGTAEADALPVQAMDAIVTGWLEDLLDPARRESVLAERDGERDRLADAIREALA
jgi:hypothetical protein